ncbi:MAG: hypothetical protein IPG51_07985 [Chloroflexi bacterium]|nr:hypothetical protein [Chloroflexota bacterium]
MAFLAGVPIGGIVTGAPTAVAELTPTPENDGLEIIGGAVETPPPLRHPPQLSDARQRRVWRTTAQRSHRNSRRLTAGNEISATLETTTGTLIPGPAATPTAGASTPTRTPSPQQPPQPRPPSPHANPHAHTDRG